MDADRSDAEVALRQARETLAMAEADGLGTEAEFLERARERSRHGMLSPLAAACTPDERVLLTAAKIAEMDRQSRPQ